MAGIQDILRPITLTKVISRQAAATSLLLQRFGMQPGGKNELYVGHGREGSYHVYNNSRKVGHGTAPGTAASRGTRQAISKVPFVYPRMHEQISLLAEELHNLARIDDPRIRDEAGADYISRQTMTLSQKAANWRTALLVGMLRDSLYVQESGSTWYPSYTSSGAMMQIKTNIPTGNLSYLNMLNEGNIIDTPWSNPGANIPLHLSKINRAFQQLTGGRLSLVMCDSITWSWIITNDAVASTAGIANSPFRTFERQVGVGPDGTPINAFVGSLLCAPGVEFFITDEGLEIGAPGSEVFTPHIEAGKAVFSCDPLTTDTTAMYLGSEPIAERDGAPKQVKTGLASWSVEASNPTATNVFALDNALPVAMVPAAFAYGTVS